MDSQTRPPFHPPRTSRPVLSHHSRWFLTSCLGASLQLHGRVESVAARLQIHPARGVLVGGLAQEAIDSGRQETWTSLRL